MEITTNVKSIEPRAFLRGFSSFKVTLSISNSHFSIDNNVLYDYDKTRLMWCPNTDSTNFDILDSVYSIEPYAFEFTSFKTINIPNSVNMIGEGCFYKCASLASIDFPQSIDAIPDYICYQCTSLSTVNMINVASIGLYAFQNCINIQSIGFPGCLTSIGDYAFHSCSSITSVDLPDSVESIGSQAFAFCVKLGKGVYGGKGLKNIGHDVFLSSGIKKSYLPPAVSKKLGL